MRFFARVALTMASVCLLVATAASSAAAASSSSPEPLARAFSADDQTAMAAHLATLQSAKDGLFLNSAAQTSYAVQTLDLLGVAVAHKSKMCASLAKLYKDDDAGSYAVIAAGTVGCGDAAAAVATIQKDLDSGVLQRVHTGVRAAVVGKLAADAVSFAAAVQTLADLAEIDGTYRFAAKDDVATLANAGLAYEIVGLLHARASSLPSDVASQLAALKCDAADVDAVLSAGITPLAVDFSFAGTDDEHGVLQHRQSPLGSAAKVVVGVAELARASRVSEWPLTSTHIRRLAAFLTSAIDGAVRPCRAFCLVRALAVLGDNPVLVPTTLSLTHSKDKKTVTGVSVTDVMGRKVKGSGKVTLKQLKPSNSGIVESAGRDVDVSDGALDLKSLKGSSGKPLAPGIYKATFAFKAPKKSAYASDDDIVRTVKVYGELSRVTFAVAASEEQPDADNKRLAHPDQRVVHPATLKSNVDVSAGDWLVCEVDVTASTPASQVFVQFIKNGETANFVARSTASSKSKKAAATATYRAVVNIKSAQFLAAASGSGMYSINVVVGSAMYKESVTWAVGSIDLSMIGEAKVSLRIAKKLNAAGAVKLGTGRPKLPDIEHMFQPETTTSASRGTLALLFTGVACLPLLALLTYLSNSGVRVMLPTGVEFPAFAAFQMSMVSVVLVIIVYWLRLSIFTALTLLAINGIAIFFAGSYALAAVARRRVAADKKK